MIERKKPVCDKCLLTLSAMALIFFTTPAWVSGFCAAAVACVLLAVCVWKLPDDCVSMRNLLTRQGSIVLGVLVAFAYAFNFYNNWLDSRYMLVLANLLGVEPSWAVGGVTVLAAVATVPSLTFGIAYSADVLREEYQRANVGTREKLRPGRIPFSKAIMVLCVVNALGISAILRANFLYLDDAGRAAYGYKDWDYFGRFLSTAMASLVHTRDYLADAAPMPQLLAAAMMALAGILVLYILYDRTEFSLWEVLPMSALCLNPYFLSCISYRFDAPYMAASVFGGILPLLFYRRNPWVYAYVSMLGALAVCTSYQAALGIFPMLVILLALRMWNRGETMKTALNFCLRSAGGFGLGLLYYNFILLRPADVGYVSTSLSAETGLLETILYNLGQYYSRVITDCNLLWFVLLLLLAAAFLWVTVRSSGRKGVVAAAVSVLALVLMLLLCFGLYPALEKPLFHPRAMYGFGVLLGLLCAVTVEDQDFGIRLPALALSWVFFVFAFNYGNALNYQREYTDYRIELVLDDLNDMDIFLKDSTVEVQISGSIGDSPIVQNMYGNGNMLNRLVPETFAGLNDLAQYRFFSYYKLPNVEKADGVDLNELDLPVVKDTMYHTIRAGENCVLIILK